MSQACVQPRAYANSMWFGAQQRAGDIHFGGTRGQFELYPPNAPNTKRQTHTQAELIKCPHVRHGQAERYEALCDVAAAAAFSVCVCILKVCLLFTATDANALWYWIICKVRMRRNEQAHG